MTTETLTDTPRTHGIFHPFRSEARSLVGLAVPLIAGSASFTLFGLINSIFLGPLGEVPLAAVSGPDAAVVSLKLPGSIREGEVFDLTAPFVTLIARSLVQSARQSLRERACRSKQC